ncbi:hypothetical protein [Saccharopolyspora phatthalungensis]|uniref:Putative membrane protein n=1 Tax=Saccharopolyspora phatthalungensis TaxID=664693 RepID=A0A840PY10_9PSEU|nr:hypothetical protein [Saccharopolyspora phatthalungensis]MBB5153196.1 putative membrane protein [Saccharopolyspora phatthalungensis]
MQWFQAVPVWASVRQCERTLSAEEYEPAPSPLEELGAAGFSSVCSAVPAGTAALAGLGARGLRRL